MCVFLMDNTTKISKDARRVFLSVKGDKTRQEDGFQETRFEYQRRELLLALKGQTGLGKWVI